MSRDDGWIEWLTPNLLQAIADGRSEDDVVSKVLAPKREQVRRLFRELQEQQGKSRKAVA